MSDKLKVSKVESKGYGIIYKLPMQDKELDVVAKSFYAYICSYAGAGDTAFPGMDKICSDLGVSRQRLERHRKTLVEKGYITINKIKDNKGRFDRNEYLINKELVPMLQKPTTDEPTMDEPTMDEPTMDEPTTENVTTNNNSFNNNSSNNNSSNIKPSSHKFSTFDVEASERLFELMKINNPGVKEPNIEKWANEVRLMRERDKRTEEQIMYLINWSQSDTFWQSYILSIKKLREKFDTLVMRVKSDKQKQNNTSWQGTQATKNKSALDRLIESEENNYGIIGSSEVIQGN